MRAKSHWFPYIVFYDRFVIPISLGFHYANLVQKNKFWWRWIENFFRTFYMFFYRDRVKSFINVKKCGVISL